MMMSAMMMMTMMMSAMMIMVRTVGHNLHSAKLWLHSSRTWWWQWLSLQWWWETRSSLQGRCSLWLNDHDDWSGDTMAFGTMARELLSLKGTSSTPLEAGQVKLYWQGILWIIQLSLSNAFNFPQTLFFICFHWKVFKANTITIDNEKALVLTFAFYFLTSSPLKDDDFVMTMTMTMIMKIMMMMTMVMMMMMIMTDPFTTNLVVKGPVAKGSVVKGAHPFDTVVIIIIIIVT